jgi:hypothetical protein
MLTQGCHVDHASRGKLLELLQVHDRVGTVGDAPEAAFGETPLQRHLPALEATGRAAARSRAMTLVAAR